MGISNFFRNMSLVNNRFYTISSTSKELEFLDAAIENFHPIVEKLTPAAIIDGTEKVGQIKIVIHELQQSVKFLAQGLDPLSKQVNDFFHAILSGGNAFLDSLRLFEVQGTPIRDDLS